MNTIQSVLHEIKQEVEADLLRLVPPATTEPAILHEGMRYSLMAGGKRIRPVLCRLTAMLYHDPLPQWIKDMSCCLEILHTYTLIHDDLPCMDDDDLRRGKPTLHKVIPEGIALLAGDALLTHAFGLIATVCRHQPETGLRLVEELAVLTGSTGVIGGQVLDLQHENQPVTYDTLRNIHLNKTAKLIQASVRMGAIAAGAGAGDLEILSRFGVHLGYVFQIADDLLDVTGNTEQMGKHVQKDQGKGKATYPSICGLENARSLLVQESEQALSLLNELTHVNTHSLKELTSFLVSRDH